jgi:hypothetical protein
MALVFHHAFFLPIPRKKCTCPKRWKSISSRWRVLVISILVRWFGHAFSCYSYEEMYRPKKVEIRHPFKETDAA